MSEIRPFAESGTPTQWVRPRPFQVRHVDLVVTIDLDRERVEGVVEHTVQWLAHGGRRDLIELDQEGLQIGAVTVDGQAAIATSGPGRLAIGVGAGGDERRVGIAFVATRPAKGLFFTPADAAAGHVAMAWTQGAMEDHHHWFPCWDSPNNLATYRISIRHRAALVAVANGDPLGRTDHGNGWATTVFVQDRPHVLYLLNVVVGDLVPVNDNGGPVPVTHWLPRGHEAKAGAMFRATAFALRWLAAATSAPYPWTRYGHVVVHRFLWGGMENTTLTTISDRVLMSAADQERDEVDADALVIHELVHQWYGDLLTMKGWSDIWLNESFATWLEARCTAAYRAVLCGVDAGEERQRLLWANREAWLEEDGGRYRRALVTNRWADAYELFDRVAYEKGSVVLECLAAQLGEARMSAALALYTARHAHDLVETADWRQAIEDATGEPLDWWFAQWVERAGHPAITVTWKHDPARGRLTVELRQTQEGEPFRLPLTVCWPGRSERIELDAARGAWSWSLGTAPAWVCVDPLGEIPAVWNESDAVDQLLARLGSLGCAATGRARAARALGTRAATPAVIAALAEAARARAALVAEQAIAALGALRAAPAVTALRELATPTGGISPRLRRAVAAALGRARGIGDGADLAAFLVAWADVEPSPVTAGAVLAARGAIEHPGATAVLRARLEKPSWNNRLRIGCIKGLGASGEAAALDDLLAALAPTQPESVRCAACAAIGGLATRHAVARERVRRRLEDLVDDPAMHVRSAAISALGTLGDPAARPVLAARHGREPFGNVLRVLRETEATLAKAGDQMAVTAALTRRIDDLEKERATLAARLEALEKRLG
jgi:aminopeptidase N